MKIDGGGLFDIVSWSISTDHSVKSENSEKRFRETNFLFLLLSVEFGDILDEH